MTNFNFNFKYKYHSGKLIYPLFIMATFKRRVNFKKSLVKRAKGNLKAAKSNADALTQTIS